MKIIILVSLVIGSFTAKANDNFLFECHSKAVEAAKAIDALNFKSLSRSAAVIEDRIQRSSFAKIEVSFDKSKNRQYTVKLLKNRGASLRGDEVTTDVNCMIESVELK